MISLRRQIARKVGELLQAAGFPVFEKLDDAIAANKAPAVIYAWAGDDTRTVGDIDQHQLTLAVSVLCKGASADDAAEDLLCQVTDLLFANRHFDKLARNFRIGQAQREDAPEGATLVLLTQHYELEYTTKRGSLYLPPAR